MPAFQSAQVASIRTQAAIAVSRLLKGPMFQQQLLFGYRLSLPPPSIQDRVRSVSLTDPAAKTAQDVLIHSIFHLKTPLISEVRRNGLLQQRKRPYGSGFLNRTPQVGGIPGTLAIDSLALCPDIEELGYSSLSPVD
jgi:hypothetical protein